MSLSKVVKIVLTGGAAVAALAATLFLMPDDPEEEKAIYEIVPGTMVQWESCGTFIFPTPRKVERVEKSDMGIYVFVEGAKTGIPINQIVPIS